MGAPVGGQTTTKIDLCLAISCMYFKQKSLLSINNYILGDMFSPSHECFIKKNKK